MSANNEQQAPESLGDVPISKGGIIILTVYLLSMTVLLLVFLYMFWPTCAFPSSVANSNQSSRANANGNDNRNTARSTTDSVNRRANTPGNGNSTPPAGGANPPPATTTPPAGGENPQPNPTPPAGGANQTPSAVEVLSVSPDSGPASGDRLVTISGSGFKENVKVSFGGADAKVEAATDKTILVKTPAHEPGKVEVTVVNSDQGFKTLPSAYTYSCPLIPASQVLLLAILAGALGGTIHALRSFFWYVGNRECIQSWVLMYIFLPFTGAAIAAVFFFIFRGGFITSPAAAETSMFIIAVAALTGLFSEQAALKLKDIADAFFTKPGKGDDHKPQESKSTGESGANNSAAGTAAPKIDPAKGTVKGGTPVTITGVKYSKAGLKITFGGADATDINVVNSVITAKTPPHEKPEPVDVIITSPEGPDIKLKYTYE